MLWILELQTHSIANKLGYWKRSWTTTLSVTFFPYNKEVPSPKHFVFSTSVVNLEEDMLQSPADFSFELPGKLPTRQPVGTNNKTWNDYRKENSNSGAAKA